ncbi:2Fe-2S iron-sulfur cluster-binding protein [Tepidibacillus infernus]|uniref:2Fe-2S iron-sulfur cluster-binding protein n=1 Tax=Tepidibacillus infernus TaxID=1806172 RepID=UPI003B73B7E1
MSETILFLPDQKKFEVKPGTTILQAALKSGVHLGHKCGGRGACLTCKVKIDDNSAVSQPTKSELQKLGKNLIKAGTRLGCQTKVLKRLKVEVPEEPLKAAIRKQLAKQKNESFWDD